MSATFILSKMVTTPGPSIHYTLKIPQGEMDVSELVGKKISLKYSGNIFCINCQKKTKKSYSQGYCFPCTIKLPETDLCILKPETCHFAKGTCRDSVWGEENCFKEHIVYLANSSGLKVGITRKSQVPFRWMDQGATAALPILEVKNRFVSGQIEVLFKKHISDKTDWRKMLKGEPESIDLLEWKVKLLELIDQELKGHNYTVLNEPVRTFKYPVLQYPEKVSSFNLDKVAHIQARLMGIKGQYLIFESGVLNIRAHTGYEVLITEEGETSDGTQNNSPEGL